MATARGKWHRTKRGQYVRGAWSIVCHTHPPPTMRTAPTGMWEARTWRVYHLHSETPEEPLYLEGIRDWLTLEAAAQAVDRHTEREIRIVDDGREVMATAPTQTELELGK